MTAEELEAYQKRGAIAWREGIEHERRLVKYRQEMYEVIEEWMSRCNHQPESNCVHQRKAQRVLDRVNDCKDFRP